MTSPPKVLAIASVGGHWVQLMRLAPAWEDCDVTYVTTDPGFEIEVRAAAANRAHRRPRFYSVLGANRWQKVRLVLSALQVAFLVARLRPDVIVTTGSAPGFFAILVGRRLGARTVWIDSIANAEEMSLSGQKAGRHVTLWLTQWPHLATPEGPEYRGSVF